MKELKPEKIAQIKQILKELDVNPSNQSLIQDNKIIFLHNDKVYRCRMPNQKEQTTAEQMQNKLKIRLIQEDDTITRKRLIQVLKEKQNVDIKKLEEEKNKLRDELQDAYLDLAVVPSDDKDKIEQLRSKKNNIEEKFMEITIEIVEMLSPCIEEQIKIKYYKYLAYVCSEKQVKENDFEKIWDNFDQFEEEKTGLSYKSIEALQTLLLNIKE